MGGSELRSWNAIRGIRDCARLLGMVLAGCMIALAAPRPVAIGPGLYAYISDSDSSANSTFLVGDKGILVVDTGLNAHEGAKLLDAIHSVSSLPIAYVVNTHYHPDHQGANSAVGSRSATVISTDFTREATRKIAALAEASLVPAQVTFDRKLTLHLDPYTAEIYFFGKAHTSGDALVYFPQQHAIAMGDLFLNHSSPAMDNGSVGNWIGILDHVLGMSVDKAVPGHFELGSRDDLRRFRDYLSDLYGQVRALRDKGKTLAEVRSQVHMEKYADFRQYPKYEATFADNAETIYQELGKP